MPHVQQQIRDLVATTITGLATTGTKVTKTAAYAIPQDSGLPGHYVFTNSEEVEFDAMGDPPTYRRRLEVIIQGFARGATTGPDTTLNTMVEEVEVAMGADLTLGGLVEVIMLESIEYVYSGEGEAPMGSARMTYTAEYRTSVTDPTVSI